MSSFIRSTHTGRSAPLARFSLAAAGLAAALVLAAPGQAQTPSAAAPVTANATATTTTTGLASELPRLLEQLVQKGYRDIREVERKSDKLVEVKARNASGQPVELYVDSRSGEVLREKRDR